MNNDDSREKLDVTPEKIDGHRLFFETPLYEKILQVDLEENIFRNDVDAYNSISGFDTTFTVRSQRIDSYSAYDYYDYFCITLTCKRRSQDILRFFFHITSNYVIKVGQDPSLADIQFADVGKKYDKILTKDDLERFKKAIGLAAHGAGAGSLVYLRKIFENLINSTFNKNKENIPIPKEDFDKLRVNEKVDNLKIYLPKELSEMRSLYGVLSSGVHNLSEKDCLTYFPALKLSIGLILDRKISLDAEKSKGKSVKDQLQKIVKVLNPQTP